MILSRIRPVSTGRTKKNLLFVSRDGRRRSKPLAPHEGCLSPLTLRERPGDPTPSGGYDATMSATLDSNDALLVVDVQRDFCPGGALAVPEGDQVVPVLNRWIDHARQRGAAIAASCDWHPPAHVSFDSQGGPWPEHCVARSEGAEFHPELQLPEEAIVIKKGIRPDADAYSAFDQTELAAMLKDRGVQRVWIGGLALDVCVRASALDAVEHGFETHLISDACRAVEPGHRAAALDELREAGVVIE